MKLSRKITCLALSFLLLGYMPFNSAMESDKQGSTQKRPLQVTNFINNAKNKTALALNSIYKTIKSDLGLEPQVQDDQYSLVKDILAGCRLACYGLLSQKAVRYLLSKVISLHDLPPQLKNFSPGLETAINVIILTPLLEEILFTYVPLRLLGPKYGSIIGTILFGAAHYHGNPKIWAYNAVVTAATEPAKYIYVGSKKSFTFAPIIGHALHNALGFYLLSKKK